MRISVTAVATDSAVTVLSVATAVTALSVVIVIVVAVLPVYITDTLMLLPLLLQYCHYHQCHTMSNNGNCHCCDISVDSSVTIV